MSPAAVLPATLARKRHAMKLVAISCVKNEADIVEAFVRHTLTVADVLVILDNGRSHVLAGENAEILGCIRCGACLNICPVYRTVGGHAYGSVYSGPLGAVFTPAKDGMDDWHDLPDASSLCGACVEVCPIRIDIPTMLLQLRAEAARTGHADPLLRRAVRAYAAAAIRPAAFRALLGGVGLAGRAVRTPWMTSLPSSAGRAWTGSRDLPTPAPRSFHDRWKAGRGS